MAQTSTLANSDISNDSGRPSFVLTPRHELSFAEIYAIASTARSKLRKEADKIEHNLRRLVAHANLLDLAMEDLRIAAALDESCDELEREVGAELLEVEYETHSRILLVEPDIGDAFEIGSEDDELTLVRWPSVASISDNRRRGSLEQSEASIPVPDVVQQIAVASILDSIEKDLLHDASDDDTSEVLETEPCTSGSLVWDCVTAPLVECPAPANMKTLIGSAVSKAKIQTERIPAAA